MAESNPTLRELGYISERELAKLRRLKLVSQRNERYAGKGPPYTTVSGNQIVYPIEEFKRWLAARTVGAQRRNPGTIANPRLRRRAGAGAEA